jgi:hypothetical protein
MVPVHPSQVAANVQLNPEKWVLNKHFCEHVVEFCTLLSFPALDLSILSEGRGLTLGCYDQKKNTCASECEDGVKNVSGISF